MRSLSSWKWPAFAFYFYFLQTLHKLTARGFWKVFVWIRKAKFVGRTNQPEEHDYTTAKQDECSR